MIRTKGRNRFDYHGRGFVWHVAREVELRIASTDKSFAVMYELIGGRPLIAVSGPEFPGIPATLKRPTWIVPPSFSHSLGGTLVREILDWCFDPAHEIKPYEGSLGTTIERA
ncbi:MAG TPA: hypothetical protein VGE52_20900 [Pirellulales bacterium]